MQKITPFLWFDGQAEEAVRFYLSVFKDGKIHPTTRYPEEGPGEAGSVMTIDLEEIRLRLRHAFGLSDGHGDRHCEA